MLYVTGLCAIVHCHYGYRSYLTIRTHIANTSGLLSDVIFHAFFFKREKFYLCCLLRHQLGMRGKKPRCLPGNSTIPPNKRFIRSFHVSENCTIVTASIGDLIFANSVYWRCVNGASKWIFASIKSTIDAETVKFSNTLQISGVDPGFWMRGGVSRRGVWGPFQDRALVGGPGG
jgi:hypothetical protein